jgi:hypothetical protein
MKSKRVSRGTTSPAALRRIVTDRRFRHMNLNDYLRDAMGDDDFTDKDFSLLGRNLARHHFVRAHPHSRTFRANAP